MNELYTTLKQFGQVKLHEPLAKHTTFKIGGPADFFVILEKSEKLPELLQFVTGSGVPYFILGGGSNMLARDSGFQGVVIAIRDKSFVIDDTLVVASAGMNTVSLAHETVKAGLTGFEWGIGVPGTIGGALRGNAGAMGGDMSQTVEEVEAWIDGEITKLSNEECGFVYRESRFKREGGVVLRVSLRLKKSETKDGMKQALQNLQYRNKTQPQGYASTGCIFTNADIKNKELLLKHFDENDEKIQQFLRVGKISAGWLIETAGLKGRQVGQAKVSDVHGNFIVNLGGATATDVLTLIDEIKGTVYDKFGIELIEEIQIV